MQNINSLLSAPLTLDCRACGQPFSASTDDSGASLICPYCGQHHRLETPPANPPRVAAGWWVGAGLLALPVLGALVWFASLGIAALKPWLLGPGASLLSGIAFFGAIMAMILVIALWILFPVFVFSKLTRIVSLLDAINRRHDGP